MRAVLSCTVLVCLYVNPSNIHDPNAHLKDLYQRLNHCIMCNFIIHIASLIHTHTNCYCLTCPQELSSESEDDDEDDANSAYTYSVDEEDSRLTAESLGNMKVGYDEENIRLYRHKKQLNS